MILTVHEYLSHASIPECVALCMSQRADFPSFLDRVKDSKESLRAYTKLLFTENDCIMSILNDVAVDVYDANSSSYADVFIYETLRHGVDLWHDRLRTVEDDEGYVMFTEREKFLYWLRDGGWESEAAWNASTGVSFEELKGKRFVVMHNRVYFPD